MKRVKVNRVKPNELFEEWLEEWMEKADVNLKKHFSKALISLRKYPLPLRTGRDCIVLQHFGTKLCTMLDNRLEKHIAGFDFKEPSSKQIALEENQVPNFNYKKTFKQLTLDGNEVADVASKKPSKEPISKRNQVAGLGNKKTTKQPPSGDTQMVTLPAQQIISMAPQSFDIILLVDTNERTGNISQGTTDATSQALKKEKIMFEVRHLKVGDFAWIARCRTSQSELVLPYIIERKRIDDLGSSIKDGRYHEQKFRLRQSGIDNIIYMVESHKRGDKYGSLPMSTLLQASINSVVQDEFTVKFTKNHRDSMHYLALFTTALARRYNDKQLVQCDKDNLNPSNLSDEKIFLMDFKTFNQASAKVRTYTVKEMFIRQLLQLKGLSLERVIALVERYPTPTLLRQAFIDAGAQGEELLTTLKFGRLQRNFGSALSKTLFQLYTNKDLL